MKKSLFTIIGILIIVTTLGFVSAAGGCCFNPSDGLCSQNSDKQTCESLNGEFSEGANCDIPKCEQKCCVLGTTAAYVSERTCQILSRAYGFQYPENVMPLSREDCFNYAQNQEKGACLLEGEYENECIYQTGAECESGTFKPGVYCSNPELNTVCEQTKNTRCYDNDVHYVDSCGNPDEIANDCDYGSGSICRDESLKQASCKDLNCDNGRKNGEKWCINENFSQVGSGSFAQYCLNGEIKTEICGLFRAGFCEEGVCRYNPWDLCIEANLDEEGLDQESCDEDYCQFIGSFNNTGIYLDDKVSTKWNEASLQEQGALCVSNITPGLKFYSDEKETQEDKEDLDSEGDICDLGDFEVTAAFQEVYSMKITKPILPGIDGEEILTNLMLNSEKFWEEGLFLDPTGAAGTEAIISDFEFLRLNRSCLANNEDNGAEGYSCGFFDLNKWYLDDLLITEGTITEVYETISHDESDFDFNVIQIAPGLEEFLRKKCNALGDCNGKLNYKEVEGKNINYSAEFTVKTSKSKDDDDWDTHFGFVDGFSVIYSKEIYNNSWVEVSYDCDLWNPPKGGEDCSKCGDDGLPCNEYRCKSLGDKCLYETPTESTRPYCIYSRDSLAPQIISVSLEPEEIVPAFTPLIIDIETDQDSYCKFDIGTGENEYEDMALDFSKDYGRNHKLKLSLPNQKPSVFDNTTSYPLLTTDGKYELYIRCKDVVGNAMIKPELVTFEVAETPDNIPPVIYEFDPILDSAIKYNTTEKQISFKMNEPAECKWSFTDLSFNEMNNSFKCDQLVKMSNIVKDYSCEGLLTNITKEEGQSTEFFIRCKDQPWLEGFEKEVYYRNPNIRSEKYSLKPSKELKIEKLSPANGELRTRKGKDLVISLTTAEGAQEGRSTCSWKLTNRENSGSTFIEFYETDSNFHQQTITNIVEGENTLEVKCKDGVGNIANSIINFSLVIDQDPPIISRSFQFAGDLLINTAEKAECVYLQGIKPNCLFYLDGANVTKFTTLEGITHKTPWMPNVYYSIKCIDSSGNIGEGCSLIVRTY